MKPPPNPRRRDPARRSGSSPSPAPRAGGPAGRRPAEAIGPAPPPAHPPLLRDLWALALLAAAAALAAKSWFRFIGEPVADDFDFLHHHFFTGPGAWLDGGGSRFYWRPLARQLYYALFGGVMLEHPAVIAALQCALLGLAGLFLYLALRRHWPRAWCAAAATFPLLLEVSRSLIATATNFQDLGLILFSALALLLASRNRMIGALAALLAALLCKEMAVVTAAALPLVMSPPPGSSRARVRWAAAAAAVVLVWGIAYGQVLGHAHLLLARDAGQAAPALARPWLARFLWACSRSLNDAAGLAVLGSGARRGIVAALAAIAVLALVVLVRDGAARARLRSRSAWVAGGLIWFMLATATLADVYPDWRPYRSPFGVLGIGVACVALLAPLRPLLLALFVAVHVVSFALSPPPPRLIDSNFGGALFLDFARLAGFQLMVGESRRELAALPPPARGARIARHYYPQGALHAFAGDRSLQTWYRDTTLRFAGVEVAVVAEDRGAVTVLQFQPSPPRQIVPVSSLALWHLELAARQLTHQDWAAALAELDVADSLQHDRGARLFTSLVAGKRALALADAGRLEDADREAERSLELWNGNNDASYAMVISALRRGDLPFAEAGLERMVRTHPGNAQLNRLLADTRRAIAEGGGR